MKGYVYIAQMSNDQYYVGSTINTEKRLIEHNSGKTKSVANKLPLKIVFVQEYGNIQIARKIEYKIKRNKSRSIIERIITEGIIKLGP